MKIYNGAERITLPEWVRCDWPDEVIELLKNNKVTHVLLNHDVSDNSRGTGHDVLKWIEEQVHTVEGYSLPVIYVHSANPDVVKAMREVVTSILTSYFIKIRDSQPQQRTGEETKTQPVYKHLVNLPVYKNKLQ